MRDPFLLVTPALDAVEADAQALRVLRDAGADVGKATDASFFAYFPTREAAARAARSPLPPGFFAEVSASELDGRWLVVVRGRLVPAETALHGIGRWLEALAVALGGEYDGWEVAVDA